jgi:hypothetical protein
LQAVLDQFLIRNIAQRVVRVAQLRAALEDWLPIDLRENMMPLEDAEASSVSSPFEACDEDDEVLTVMREGSELMHHLSQVSALPTAPPKVVAAAQPDDDDDDDDEGAATVMMTSPVADALPVATGGDGGDEGWDAGAATMMFDGPVVAEPDTDDEDVATIMMDGVDAGTLAALEAELARREKSALPAPAAGIRAASPVTAALPAAALPAAASPVTAALPGWSSGQPSDAAQPPAPAAQLKHTPQHMVHAAAQGPARPVPGIGSPPWVAEAGTLSPPGSARREVLLRRALYLAIAVFLGLVALIVVLLMRRQ